MSSDIPIREEVDELTPAALASTVEELGRRLAGTLEDVTEPESHRRLEELLVGVRQVGSSLYSMALIFDPERSRGLAQREQELRELVLNMSQTIRDLATTNRRLAQETGAQVRELEAITELSPGEEFAERLSTAVGRVREVAKEMDGHVVATVANVEDTSRRVADLERELEDARKKVFRDSLTRINSRQALGERLQELLGGASVGEAWCFAILDIDDFKSVNDRYGHLVGDAVLYKVARLIEGAVQASGTTNFLARYGGEEFAVILVGVRLARACEVADQIRESVAASRWQYRGHPEQPIVHVTVSLGVAQHEHGDSVLSLIQRADDALYRAKRGGRNRVVVADASAAP